LFSFRDNKNMVGESNHILLFKVMFN